MERSQQDLIRIACVDDHDLFLDGIRVLFDSYLPSVSAHMFSCATTLLEALEKGDQFDVVISDLTMKHLNGISLLGELKDRAVSAPVIILSACEDVATQQQCLLAGAFHFLHKSTGREEFFAAIRAAAAGAPPPGGQGRLAPARAVSGADLPAPYLSRAQLRTLQLVAAGRTNREIAAALSISENTVKTHVKAVFRELSVRNRTAAVRRGQELKLI